MFTNKLMPLVAMLALLMFSQCAKDPIRGCLDPDSKNYCQNCDTDDGSCRYSGTLVIWYGESAASLLVNTGAETMFFYVDEQLVASRPADLYYTSTPGCSSSAVSKSIDLGQFTSGTVTYSVKDQTDFVYWDGIVSIEAADLCKRLELTL